MISEAPRIMGCSREAPFRETDLLGLVLASWQIGTPLARSPSARASSLRRPVRWSADTATPPSGRAIASPWTFVAGRFGCRRATPRLDADGAHSRFPGHALTPTGVMAMRCKQFHLPDL